MNVKEVQKIIEIINHVLIEEESNLSQNSFDQLTEIKVRLITENDNKRILEIIKELIKWFTIFFGDN